MGKLVLAVLAWTFANFFLKLARVSLSTSSVFIWQGAGIVAATLIIFFFVRPQLMFMVDLKGAVWAFIAGGVSIIGAYFFIESLGTVRLNIAVPFSSIYVVLVCVMSVVFLGEKMTFMQIVGTVAMLGGSILLGMGEK
ncbi:MAG: EamA family transporter [bacterium]|nr:EamA family transporter [bacterium]